jgi:adenylosuccinate lyase
MIMEVKLTVDGKDIEINNFVQKILAGAVTGAVGTLKDVGDDCNEIVLKIKRYACSEQVFYF